MILSQLINELEKLKAEHGDVDIALDDADTGWIFELNPHNLEYWPTSNRVEISVNYEDKAIA